MNKYQVRINIPFLYDEIEAENEEEAYGKAIEQAFDEIGTYQPHEYNYEKESCIEVS